MKNTLLIGFCFLCIGGAAVSCKGVASDKEGQTEARALTPCDTIKAKAILWVDYKKGRTIKDGTPIRTVKVLADVHADGSLDVLSFCKKQSMKVKSYLLKRVEVFRIREEMFEGNYIQPGEQYLQLRYLPGLVK